MMHNDYEQSRLTGICVIFAVVIFAILGFMPMIPTSITKLMRPLVILMFCVFPYTTYRMTASVKCMLAFMLYYVLIFLVNPMTSSAFKSVVSILTFSGLFIIATVRAWGKNEIKLIFQLAATGACIMAAITLYSNPNMLHKSGYGHLKYLGISINSNAMAFSVAPGVVCGLYLLLFCGTQKRFVKILEVISVVISLLFLYAVGCRSAFYSALFGAFLLVWEKTKYVSGKKNRIRIRMISIITIVIVLALIATVSADLGQSRLFNFSEMKDSNGRDELADRAWELIEAKPIFGGGLDYWDTESNADTGTHNGFLTTMVQSGFVGGAIIATFYLLLLKEMICTRSFIPLALAMEGFMHTMTEPSLDYYVYIPFMLSMIVTQYAKSNKIQVHRMFA